MEDECSKPIVFASSAEMVDETRMALIFDLKNTADMVILKSIALSGKKAIPLDRASFTYAAGLLLDFSFSM